MLISLLLTILPSAIGIQGQSNCDHDTLSVYKLVLETHWTEERFPKQYPLWRPPAQWSKTIGYTHDSNFSLFQLSTLASEGMKMFAETADSNGIEQEHSKDAFLDTILLPGIPTGEGSTGNHIFIDGMNSKVGLS